MYSELRDGSVARGLADFVNRISLGLYLRNSNNACWEIASTAPWNADKLRTAIWPPDIRANGNTELTKLQGLTTLLRALVL